MSNVCCVFWMYQLLYDFHMYAILTQGMYVIISSNDVWGAQSWEVILCKIFFLYWGKILRMISDLYLVGSTKMIGKLLYNLRISFIKKIFFFLNGSKLTTVTMYKIFWSGRSMSRDLLTHMYETILSGLTPFFVEQVFLRDFLF